MTINDCTKEKACLLVYSSTATQWHLSKHSPLSLSDCNMLSTTLGLESSVSTFSSKPRTFSLSSFLVDLSNFLLYFSLHAFKLNLSSYQNCYFFSFQYFGFGVILICEFIKSIWFSSCLMKTIQSDQFDNLVLLSPHVHS